MPIYEFKCPDCDIRFPRVRPMAESGDPSPCPRCLKLAGRVVSRCHFKLGWIGLASIAGKTHRVRLDNRMPRDMQHAQRAQQDAEAAAAED